MRIILILILFTIMLPVFALKLINNSEISELEYDEMLKKDMTEFDTTKEKDGESIKTSWKGVKLENLIKDFEQIDYTKIRFSSDDNYQVRLSKEEIQNSTPMLVFYKNEKLLPKEKVRLIIPELREMFWIKGISNIEFEKSSNFKAPTTIYFAEKVLIQKPLRNELKPFVKVKGYTFDDLAKAVFPLPEDEFLLISKDGVKHSLDYDKYLKNAVLILEDDNSYSLKSPDMPGGMWIKKLSYIQQDSDAIFFAEQLNSYQDLTDLIDSSVNIKINKPLTTSKQELNLQNFSDNSWHNIDSFDIKK